MPAGENGTQMTLMKQIFADFIHTVPAVCGQSHGLASLSVRVRLESEAQLQHRHIKNLDIVVACVVLVETLRGNLDDVVAVGQGLEFKAQHQTLSQAVFNACHAGGLQTEYLSGFATGQIYLLKFFFAQVLIINRFTGIRFHRFDSCHLEAKGGSHIGVYARVLRLEVPIRAYRHIPVVLGLCVDVVLGGNHHVGYRLIGFHIILARSDVDVHTERQVDVPTVGYKVLDLQTGDVYHTVVVKTVNVQG